MEVPCGFPLFSPFDRPSNQSIAKLIEKPIRYIARKKSGKFVSKNLNFTTLGYLFYNENWYGLLCVWRKHQKKFLILAHCVLTASGEFVAFVNFTQILFFFDAEFENVQSSIVGNSKPILHSLEQVYASDKGDYSLNNASNQFSQIVS